MEDREDCVANCWRVLRLTALSPRVKLAMFLLLVGSIFMVLLSIIGGNYYWKYVVAPIVIVIYAVVLVIWERFGPKKRW